MQFISDVFAAVSILMSMIKVISSKKEKKRKMAEANLLYAFGFILLVFYWRRRQCQQRLQNRRPFAKK